MEAPAFAYIRPESLEPVFDRLDRHGNEARQLAGGRNLYGRSRSDQPSELKAAGGATPQLQPVTSSSGLACAGLREHAS